MEQIGHTPESILQMVTERVKPFYNRQDKWHGLSHGQRVVDLAKRINLVEQADPFLVEVGAWLHQFHDPNLQELMPVIKDIPFSQIQREQLYEIVEQCRPNKISANSSHAARVVFDGDVLELMGPYGIVRELLCNVTDRKLAPTEALVKAKEVQDLLFSKLQTNQGKKMAQEVSKAAEDFWSSLRSWEEQFPEALRIFT